MRAALALIIPAVAIVIAGSGFFTQSDGAASDDMSEAPKRAKANATTIIAPEEETVAMPIEAQEQIAALKAELASALEQNVPEEEIIEEEVVSRQARASADLGGLQPVAQPTAVAAAEPAVVPTEPVEDERQAALTTPHAAAKLFSSGQAAIEDAARCTEDLRNLTEQAVIYFPSGGVAADASGIEQGRLIGLVAQSCEGVQIRVEGHSDVSGDPGANLRLSEQRAQHVIQRIAASGVDTSMFFAEGVGSRVPSGIVGPQPSAFYDRRVEFSVVDDVTRVSLSEPTNAQPWANQSCAVDLERAALNTSLFYAPRSVSLPGQDLDTAMELATLASACPHTRLRIVGHHSGDVQDREDISTGLLRAKALMAMMVGRGIASEKIIIAAHSRALDEGGLPGSRVHFDVIHEEE